MSPSSRSRPTSGVSRTGSCVLVSDIVIPPSRFVNRKRPLHQVSGPRRPVTRRTLDRIVHMMRIGYPP